MKNLKKFENFEGFDADEEAQRMKEDEIYASRESEEAADDIVARFEEEFADRKPSSQEFAEFYHALRTEGIDGIEIFNALGDRIQGLDGGHEEDEELGYDPDEDAESMKEDEIYSSMEEEDDFGHASHDGSFDGDDSEEDEEQYERRSLKRFNNFK